MDNTAFLKAYKRIKRNHTAAGVLFLVLYGLVYARFVSVSWRGYTELLLLFLVLLSGSFLFKRCNRKLNEFLGGYAKEVYSEHFDLEQYMPNKHVPRKTARASHLFLRDYGFSLLELSGSNLITGRYRGARFSSSYISLSKGRFSRNHPAVFCVLDHRGTVNGRVDIKSVRRPWYTSQLVSGGFDERFQTAADERESAIRILTPSFKRTIVQLDNMLRVDSDGDPRIEVCIDANCAYIVIWNRNSLFGANYESAGEIKAAAREDAGRLKTVLDAFLDQPALFPQTATDTAND